MRGFIAALQFLTICPMVGRICCSGREMGRSALFFPLVGIVLGIVLGGVGLAASHFLPALPASVLVVAALMGVSGGLHMDGLADTADGFFSSRPRHRILEIMKDSHIGAMGVMAIACCISLKIALLSSVPFSSWLQVILMMTVAGRCALVVHLGILPYARPEGGLGSVFVQNRQVEDILGSLAVLFLAGWYTGGIHGILAAALCLLGTLVFSYWCKTKIGGFTGDTLGAVCEINELIPVLVAVAWATVKARGGIA